MSLTRTGPKSFRKRSSTSAIFVAELRLMNEFAWLENLSLAVREAGVSRHNGEPIRGTIVL